MSSPDAYSTVQKGSLKLKNISEHAIKKGKKKKSKEQAKRMLEQVMPGSTSDRSRETNRVTTTDVDTRTKAEIAFEIAKEKRTIDEMVKKPFKTHKERIMQFNEHLDNLSEHDDIPKVSWTK